MEPLEVIERAASKIAPGRAPLFMESHLYRALRIIESEGPIGRMKLSKTMALGEGVIRTLTKHLAREGIIEASKEGIILTDTGRKLASSLKSGIGREVEVSASRLTLGPYNIAVLVKGGADSVRSGLEQRDAAIKVGASGATTLIMKDAKLRMPRVDEDIFKKAKMLQEELISKLRPQRGDVIIIGSAQDRSTAELGTIAAALETVKAMAQKIAKAA